MGNNAQFCFSRPLRASSVKANDNYEQEYKTKYFDKKNRQQQKSNRRDQTERQWYQLGKREKQQTKKIEKQQQQQQQRSQYRSASETKNNPKIEKQEMLPPKNTLKKLYNKNKKMKTKTTLSAEYKNVSPLKNEAPKNASHALDEKITQKLGTKFSPRKEDLRSNFKTTSLPNVKGTCKSYKKLLLSPSAKHKKRFFKETIQTIGFPHTYKEEEKCNWIFEVGDECQMGMITHEIHDGNILQSKDCSLDFLSINFNGGKGVKLCGPLTNHNQSYLWTTSQRQILNITMVTKQMSNISEIKKPLGFKMTVSGYCWLYSTSHLSKLLKNNRKLRKELPKLAPKTDNKKQKNIIDVKIINEEKKNLNSSIKSQEGKRFNNSNNASFFFQKDESEGKKFNNVKDISEVFKVTINGKLKGRIYEIQNRNKHKMNKEEKDNVEKEEKEHEQDKQSEQENQEEEEGEEEEVLSTPAASLVSFQPLYKRYISNSSFIQAQSKSSEESETNQKKRL
ncbi:hypothetical protein Avbf_01836 [Armadillidium vulgare]|nr:hypothetical protein Avbf_01836 [Armadillidium vulgare]